eukprot:TRINITY_DN8613_c0_g1_i2.p1 TRINITY_DN8613_c0_g1~~TRINITY_DN8613_c0_g1_i2.p1  ORF type:complete len:477 (+),score=114.93 TRINITY_DN8613_c0_g1_i2:87-1517(+)
MGLSHPICSKVLWKWGNEYYICGAATMQGPRKTLEDAHVLRLVGDLPDHRDVVVEESKKDSTPGQTLKPQSNGNTMHNNMLQTMMRNSTEPPDLNTALMSMGDPQSAKSSTAMMTSTMMTSTKKMDGLATMVVKGGPPPNAATAAHPSPVPMKPMSIASPQHHGTRGLLPKSERLNASNAGGDESNRLLVGVFDGHGGDHAAKYLKHHIPAEVDKIKDNLSKKTVSQMMIDLDQKYFEVTESTELKSVGSTAVVAIVSPPQQPKSCWGFRKKIPQYQIDVAHIGDSRCVLYRRDQKKFELITRDHKPDNAQEAERVKRAGGLIMDNRVDGKLAVTRSVGDWPLKNNPEVAPDRQKVIPVPDIEQRFAHEGDFLLVACDGLFEKLETVKIVEIIRDSLDEKMDPCDALVKVLDASQMAGSTDNMTAILTVFQDGTHYHREQPEFDVGKLFVQDKYEFNVLRCQSFTLMILECFSNLA